MKWHWNGGRQGLSRLWPTPRRKSGTAQSRKQGSAPAMPLWVGYDYTKFQAKSILIRSAVFKYPTQGTIIAESRLLIRYTMRAHCDVCGFEFLTVDRGWVYLHFHDVFIQKEMIKHWVRSQCNQPHIYGKRLLREAPCILFGCFLWRYRNIWAFK